MLSSRFLAQAALSFVLVLRVNAESHVIKFVNQCGYGSPALIYDGQNILTGDSYTSNGAWSGIAYLQTGYCNTNGENCTLLETTLINPTTAGGGSTTDISLIPPHEFSVETSFAYYNGCDGQGNTCSSESCTSVAFFAPTDYYAQVACEVDNVNLLVAFCADAAQLATGNADTSAGPIPSSSPLSSLSLPSLESTTPPTSLITTVPPTHILDNEPTLPSLTPMLTPTATPTTSDYSDSGCEETGETTPIPSPTPTLTATPSIAASSDPGCEESGDTAPLSTPTPPSTSNLSDSGCEETGNTTPPSTPTPITSSPGQQTVPSSSTPVTSTPALPPSSRPTTPRRCRPRPTGFTSGSPAPTRPANTATTSPIPTLTPSSTSLGAGTTADPCDDLGDIGTPSGLPSPQRRRHRRTNRIHY